MFKKLLKICLFASVFASVLAVALFILFRSVAPPRKTDFQSCYDSCTSISYSRNVGGTCNESQVYTENGCGIDPARCLSVCRK